MNIVCCLAVSNIYKVHYSLKTDLYIPNIYICIYYIYTGLTSLTRISCIIIYFLENI